MVTLVLEADSWSCSSRSDPFKTSCGCAVDDATGDEIRKDMFPEGTVSEVAWPSDSGTHLISRFPILPALP